MKRLLYLGAGGDRGTPFPEWFDSYEVVRLDLDERTNPDVIGDLADPSTWRWATQPWSGPIGDFDAIVSVHSIEHVFEHQAISTLWDLREWLAPGGCLVIACPDLTVPCRWIAEGKGWEVLYQSPAGPIRAIDMLYGHQQSVVKGFELMGHRFGYTPAALRELFESQGYHRIEVQVRGYDLVGRGCVP